MGYPHPQLKQFHLPQFPDRMDILLTLQFMGVGGFDGLSPLGDWPNPRENSLPVPRFLNQSLYPFSITYCHCLLPHFRLPTAYFLHPHRPIGPELA